MKAPARTDKPGAHGEEIQRDIPYFAYGSNMSPWRLRHRIPGARPASVARASGRRLAFHKKGTDGSGKCDIPRAPGQVVYGVLYPLSPADFDLLDRFEGCGSGYERATLAVQDDAGREILATTYFATAIDAGARPYTWYLRHVVEGARFAELPEGYLTFIEATEAVVDPDPDREAAELAIYRQQVDATEGLDPSEKIESGSGGCPRNDPRV